MLISLDNKIHHLKELDFIERTLLYEVLSPESFYKDLSEFLVDSKLASIENIKGSDLKKVDKFVEEYFAGRIETAKIWLLRTYIVGRFLADTDIGGQIFNIGLLNSLPKFAKDAAQKYGLTLHETKMLSYAVEQSATELSNTSISTMETVRRLMVENIKLRGNSKSLLEKLKETITGERGELNRDWQRVAITEANSVFNNAYISTLKDGDHVVGISMPDACEHCMELINGKVYKVRSSPPPDYRNLSGAEYEKCAKVWDTEVWEGKNNYGRSGSNKKRINPTIGNKKDNLRDKHHHEHNTPVLPLHPFDRCR